MFPWAARGDLGHFWEENTPALDEATVVWALEQFIGMAGAIEELHREKSSGAHCRHGDLKPQNILCFGNEEDPITAAKLVIADVGLARIHNAVTADRLHTKPSASTIMYEAPEMKLYPLKSKPRRIDVWSMGCVLFEFVVWLLYGQDGLDRFSKCHGSAFYKTQRERNRSTAAVHEGVTQWINHIRADYRCSEHTALRSVVDLIANELLVVAMDDEADQSLEAIEEDWGLPSPPVDIPVVNIEAPTDGAVASSNGSKYRATSLQMKDALVCILQDLQDREISAIGKRGGTIAPQKALDYRDQNLSPAQANPVR